MPLLYLGQIKHGGINPLSSRPTPPEDSVKYNFLIHSTTHGRSTWPRHWVKVAFQPGKPRHQAATIPIHVRATLDVSINILSFAFAEGNACQAFRGIYTAAGIYILTVTNSICIKPSCYFAWSVGNVVQRQIY